VMTSSSQARMPEAARPENARQTPCGRGIHRKGMRTPPLTLEFLFSNCRPFFFGARGDAHPDSLLSHDFPLDFPITNSVDRRQIELDERHFLTYPLRCLLLTQRSRARGGGRVPCPRALAPMGVHVPRKENNSQKSWLAAPGREPGRSTRLISGTRSQKMIFGLLAASRQIDPAQEAVPASAQRRGGLSINPALENTNFFG